MVPAPVLGARVAQNNGAEWTELDQQNIDNFHFVAEQATASAVAPVPVQDNSGQWYLPDPQIQYIQPPGGAAAAGNNSGVNEQHPGKQELVLGEKTKSAEDDWFGKDE